MNNKKCGCGSDLLNTSVNNISHVDSLNSDATRYNLASIFINFQPKNSDTYTFCEGLANGTIYPDLNKPYVSNNCRPEVCHE
jgi:hypothetical protein